MESPDPVSIPGAAGSVPRRVHGGTLLLVLGRLWGSACFLLVLWLLAGALEPAPFGRYTFYVALFMLLDSLVDFGTGAVAVQRSAGRPEAVAPVLAAARRIRLAMGLLGLLIVGGGAFIAGEEGAVWIAVAALYPLTHALGLSATIYANRISWGVPVASRAIARAVSLAIVLVMVQLEVKEPMLYLCGFALGSASGNFLLHAVARKHLPRERPPSIPVWVVYRAALPLGLAALCQQTYFYIDNLFVRALRGPEELGPYNVGVRIMSVAIMVALYATQAALPWLTREHREGRLGRALERLSQPLFAAAGLVAGLLMPWSGELLALFRPGFASAGPALAWLLAASAAVYAGAAFMTGLLATGRTRSVLYVSAGALLVNLLGNAALVPSLGSEGAALATLVTECAVAAGALCLLLRRDAGFLTRRAWLWLGGPLALCLAYAVSCRLPLERLFGNG